MKKPSFQLIGYIMLSFLFLNSIFIIKLNGQTTHSLDSFIFYDVLIDSPRVKGFVLDKDEDGRAIQIEEHKFVNGEPADRFRTTSTYYDNGTTATYCRYRTFFQLDTFHKVTYEEYNYAGESIYRNALSDYAVSRDPHTLEIRGRLIDTIMTDGSGRIVERLRYHDTESGREIISKHQIIWENNQKDSVYYFSASEEGMLQLRHISVYDYPIGESGYVMTIYNGFPELNYETIYTYLPNGDIDTILEFEFNGSDTTTRSISLNSYHPFRRKVNTFSIDLLSGDTLFKSRSTHHYLDADRRFLEETLNERWNHETHKFELSTGLKNYYSILSNTEELAQEYDLKLYPNPANTHLSLQGDPDWVIKTVQVFTAEGQVLRNLHWIGEDIDTHDWPNGLYLILINGQISRKVLIQH